MRILAIETSCDETAIAILDNFKLISNQVLSQIKTHKKFGGVVPNLAMREHRKNLPIILKSALEEASKNLTPSPPLLRKERGKEITNTLPPYEGGRVGVRGFDAIAVTSGPGLEPALWEGINFAKALSKKWHVPLVAVNHLEGHIYASWLPPAAPSSTSRGKTSDVFGDSTSDVEERDVFPGAAWPKFPLLALIVSGGHTELVLMKKHLDYKILGQTLDDAAGEAFDKVARMLGLGYPGGPEISKLAEKWKTVEWKGLFPRPMINSKDLNFSFSGLKTAVLYYLRDNPRANKAEVAYEFQQATIDVLTKKTTDALRKYRPKSLVVGGGVAANKTMRSSLSDLVAKSFPGVSLHISPLWLCGDNAAMIAVAGYFRYRARKFSKPSVLKAQGNLKLS